MLEIVIKSEIRGQKVMFYSDLLQKAKSQIEAPI